MAPSSSSRSKKSTSSSSPVKAKVLGATGSKVKSTVSATSLPASPTRRSSRGRSTEQAESKADSDNEEDQIEEDGEGAEEAIGEDGLSAYERARLENIRRNEMFLSELGVASVRQSFSESAKKPKAVKRSKPVNVTRVPALPTRRSSRVTVDKLSAEIAQLRNEGNNLEADKLQEELDAKLAKQMEGSYEVELTANAAEPYARLAEDPIPFTNLLNEDVEEKQITMAKEIECIFQEIIREEEKVEEGKEKKKNGKTGSTTSKSSASSKFLDATASVFAKLQIKEDDVVKMTPNRMTSVALHPSDSKILAAGGDKAGYIALWDVEYGGDDHEGVYRYRPHISNVCKIHFPDDDYSKMYTSSYDGTVRLLDIHTQAFTLMFEAPETIHETYFSDASFLYNQPSTVLLSKSNGSVGLVDFRSTNKSYQWSYDAQDCRLTSVQQHPTDPNLIITAGSKDGGIAIHDLRKAGKNWKSINYLTAHTKSINAAYVSPDGQYLVSVSQDDSVRTWKDFTGNSGEVKCKKVHHNNFTGRWLSTFRPTFDPKRANTLVLGSMQQPRRMEIFSVKETGTAKNSDYSLDLIFNLQGDFMNSVNSRNCFHSKLEMVLGSNSSGKVHLFR
jgi:hypothetical protein